MLRCASSCPTLRCPERRSDDQSADSTASRAMSGAAGAQRLQISALADRQLRMTVSEGCVGPGMPRSRQSGQLGLGSLARSVPPARRQPERTLLTTRRHLCELINAAAALRRPMGLLHGDSSAGPSCARLDPLARPRPGSLSRCARHYTCYYSRTLTLCAATAAA